MYLFTERKEENNSKNLIHFRANRLRNPFLLVSRRKYLFQWVLVFIFFFLFSRRCDTKKRIF